VARVRRLDDLLSDVRLRADNSALDDATITEFINQSITDLYDMLVLAFGDTYFEVETTRTTSPSLATVALPDDFYKLTGLFWTNGTRKFPIRQVPQLEAEAFVPGAGWSDYSEVKYRLQIGNLKFYPTPLGIHAVTIKYVPSAVRLVNDSDTFDGYNGWEEWPVIDAAMKCLEREGNDGDAALLQPRKDRMEMRIAAMSDRNEAEPMRIQDIHQAFVWPFEIR